MVCLGVLGEELCRAFDTFSVLLFETMVFLRGYHDIGSLSLEGREGGAGSVVLGSAFLGAP